LNGTENEHGKGSQGEEMVLVKGLGLEAKEIEGRVKEVKTTCREGSLRR